MSRATFDLPSRVADNLFWLGRYVERVEQAVRIARAVMTRIHQESDPAKVAGLNAGLRVLSALGHIDGELPPPGNRAAALERELLAMVYDSSAPSSLGWTLHQLRRVAWLLRDRISTDAWRVLNHFTQQFATAPVLEPLRLTRAIALLDEAIIMLSAFSGLVMESMTRGHGWRFLDLGRRLERAIETVALLAHGLLPAQETGQLEALLEIADSALTYRSRYLTSMRADLLLDLLLLDEANPRSVAFQLARVCEHIAALPESESPVRRPAEWRLARRLLSAVQIAELSELVRKDEAGRWSNLEQLLDGLAAELPLLSETLTRAYLDHAVPAQQLSA